MENQKKLDELHNEHKLWINELEFAEDEIKTFRNRLSEVVSKNTKTDVLAPAEHFQNQFIRQQEVIDELKHDVNAEEHKVAVKAQENNVAADHTTLNENDQLVDRMQMFTKLFKELKEEYNVFLAKVM
jgi:predicted nuclease with TOPRIM domain